jgi:hypothetical protein
MDSASRVGFGFRRSIQKEVSWCSVSVGSDLGSPLEFYLLASIARSERGVNIIVVTAEPSQDGRQVGRVFALGMGILFGIIFVLHAITF